MLRGVRDRARSADFVYCDCGAQSINVGVSFQSDCLQCFDVFIRPDKLLDPSVSSIRFQIVLVGRRHDLADIAQDRLVVGLITGALDRRNKRVLERRSLAERRRIIEAREFFSER